VNRLAALRLPKAVGKTENLEAIAITDEPWLQLVSPSVGRGRFDETRQPGLPFYGSIGTGRPAS